MDEPNVWAADYEVWRDGDGWYARRTVEITPEQCFNGVRKVIEAPTFIDLEREAVAQCVAANLTRHR